MIWQVEGIGPDVEEGLVRALAGGALGIAVGAAPIVVAAALGQRWPFHPGDVLLFTALGVLVGARGLLWVMLLGSLVSLARHVCLQRWRGRSWSRGYVALGPGMAAAALAVFVVSNFGFVAGPGR